MKIKRIEASNFLSFENIEINLSDNKKEEENNGSNQNSNQNEEPQQEQIQNYFVLVGPNGSGKTNVVRLLEFVGNVFINNGVFTGDITKYIRNGEDGFDISVSFTLDKHDRELLNAYLIFTIMSMVPEKISSEDDRKKMYEFLLKERYNLIDDGEPEITFNINASKFETQDSKIIYNFNNHHLVLYQKIPESGLSLTADSSGISTTGKELSELIIEEAKQNNYERLRSLADIIITYKELNIKNHGILIMTKNYIDHIVQSIRNNVNINEPFKKLLVTTYFDFENDLKFMGLDLKRDTISLGNFLARLYNFDIVLLANPRAPLKGSFKYTGIKQEENLEPTIRAIEGEELTKRLFKIAHSENENEHEAWLELQKSMCGLLHMKPRFVLENDTAKIILEEFEDCKNGDAVRQVSFDYAPAGAIELLTVLASVAVASEKVLLLDEPAANLHPPFQKKLYNYIKRIADHNNAQVIMITHSPYMINPHELENVWRMYLDHGSSNIVNVGKNLFENREKEQVKIEKQFIRETKLLESLFADAVVITEGEGEEEALEVWFGNSPTLSDKGKYIVILSAGSKYSLNPYVSILNSLNIKCFVFCDEDAYINTVKTDSILSELDKQDMLFWAGKYGKRQIQEACKQNEVIYHDTACYLYELYSDYKEIQNNYECRDWINNKDKKEDCKNLKKGEPVCKDPSVLLAVAKMHDNDPPQEVQELIDAIVSS